MNLDDLLKSIREEDDDSKGGKINGEKFLKRKTFENPLKGQRYTAPSIPGDVKPLIKPVVVNISLDKLIPSNDDAIEKFIPNDDDERKEIIEKLIPSNDDVRKEIIEKLIPSNDDAIEKLIPNDDDVSKEILEKLDELIDVIKADNELEKKEQDYDRKKDAKEKRQKREKRIEVGKIFANARSGVKKAIGGLQNVFNTIIRFLAFTLLGQIVKFVTDFLGDPKNKKFIEDAQKFISGIPDKLKEVRDKLIPVIDWFKEQGPKIAKFAEDFRKLLAKFPFLGQYFATEKEKEEGLETVPGTKLLPGQGVALPDVGPGGVPMIIPFATGGFAMGTDTVPAMLTPGEFIMSRGAVNMFGADTMMAMNKAGGGTNRPKFGLVSGFSGGGAVQLIRDEMDRRGITDAKTRAMYLAQFKAESGFQNVAERGHSQSSAAHIRSIFEPPKIKLSDAELNKLKMNDKAFFDYMYGPYMGNEGEGYKYRGRGFIQLTGKDNYRHFGNKIGVDLVNNPDLLLDPEIGAKASFAFMEESVDKGALARGDLRAVTKSINGGYNHLQQRGQYYNEFLPQEIEYLKTRSKTKDSTKLETASNKDDAPPVIPSYSVGESMGPGFDSNDRAQAVRMDLIDLMNANRAKQSTNRFSGFDLDFIFKPIREFLGVDTPNTPTSTKIIVLPTVKQTAQQPSTQVDNEIPNFKISSSVKMRGLVGKALGIEDLVT